MLVDTLECIVNRRVRRHALHLMLISERSECCTLGQNDMFFVQLQHLNAHFVSGCLGGHRTNKTMNEQRLEGLEYGVK